MGARCCVCKLGRVAGAAAGEQPSPARQLSLSKPLGVPLTARAHGHPAQPPLHAGLCPLRDGNRCPERQLQRDEQLGGVRVPAAGERGGRPDQPAQPGVEVSAELPPPSPCRPLPPRTGGAMSPSGRSPLCRPSPCIAIFFLCSYAEQLVLYLKVAELLSSGLQMAIEQIKAGKLCLSSTVKQGKSPPGARPTGLHSRAPRNGRFESAAEGVEGGE